MLTASVALAHTDSPAPSSWLLPLVALAVPIGLYLLGRVRFHDRHRSKRWSDWRTAAFVVGVALLGLAICPAMEAWAVQSLRGHMVQHLLIGMFAPLGLVLGAPVTLFLGAGSRSVRHAVRSVLRNRPVRWLSHPISAAVLAGGGMYALYLTPLYAASTQHTPVHLLVHLHFLVAGYLFTWSLVGPDPSPHRPGIGVRLTALVLAAAAHGYLGKLLYSRAPELPEGSGHDVADVRIAAQWMYYGGDLAEVLLAVALFSWWYRSGARGRTVVSA